ncbi:hypothetical protein LguiA_020214 [Lonicera macranthoides]
MEFNLPLRCTFLQVMIPREMARFHASYGRTLESLKARMWPDKFTVLLMSLMASVQLQHCFGWQRAMTLSAFFGLTGYVEQLVASAEAAVEELIHCGVTLSSSVNL